MPRRWRSFLVAAALALGACGGAPASPVDPSAGTSTSQSWSIAGTVVDAVTGVPITGASVAFAGQPVITTSAGGRWTYTGTGPVAARQAVTVSAAGYVSRETAVRWEQTGRTDIALDLLPDAPPFSLAFYREFVRNGYEEPGSLEPIRRWTTAPDFYVNTYNPATGRSLEADETGLVVRALRDSVPQLTGGMLSAGTIETSPDGRANRKGVINVRFEYSPSADYCGRALVGADPGEIIINYDRCAALCGSLKVTPETIAHEVGHAMGFYHTTGNGVMSPSRVRRCGNVNFTDNERLHARLSYLRAPGNVDADRDPAAYAGIESGGGEGRFVICRR